MTDEEIKKRKNDDFVKYIKDNHLYNYKTARKEDKYYVFISYKSDDWNLVLSNAVYRLAHDYGLNVYFDADFDDNNDIWTEQLINNMSTNRCAGVLAFISKKYAASYATLLELMYSQTEDANIKKVVPVNLCKNIEISGDEGDEDTKLGDEDGNENAPTEKALFVRAFKENVKKENLNEFLYNEKRPLNKRNCSKIVKNLIKSLKVSKNQYEENGDLKNIVNTIRNTFGDRVFSKEESEVKESSKEETKPDDTNIVTSEGATSSDKKSDDKPVTSFERVEVEKTQGKDIPNSERDVVPSPLNLKDSTKTTTEEGTKTAKEDDTKETSDKKTKTQQKITGRYTINEFINNKKGITEDSFTSIQLIDEKDDKKYSTGKKTGKSKCKALIIEFTENRFNESGIGYIELVNHTQDVNSRRGHVTNHLFMPTEEYKNKKNEGKISVRYDEINSSALKGYSICTNYNTYDMIKNGLVTQIDALGLDKDKLILEFKVDPITHNDNSEVEESSNEESKPDNTNTGTSEDAISSDKKPDDKTVTSFDRAEVEETQEKNIPNPERNTEVQQKITDRYSINEFISNKKGITEDSFASIQLIGVEDYEKYSTGKKTGKSKCKALIIEFTENRFNEFGIEYIELVNHTQDVNSRREHVTNHLFMPTEEYKK